MTLPAAPSQRGRRWLPLFASFLAAILLGIPPLWLLPQPPVSLALPTPQCRSADGLNPVPATAPLTCPDVGITPQGLAVFRYSLNLPAADAGLTLHFISLTPNARVLLNGHELYTRTTEGGPYFLTRPLPVLLPLPTALLTGGTNRIDFAVSGFGRSTGPAPPVFAGPETELRPVYGWAWLVLELLPHLILGGSVLMGCFLLALWSGRRQERAYLVLGIILLLNASRLILYMSPNLPVPDLLLKLSGYGMLWQPALMPAFAVLFIGRKPSVWIWLPVAMSLPLTISGLLMPDLLRVRFLMAATVPFFGYCVAACIWTLVPAAWRDKSIDARVLLGFACIVASVFAIDRFSHGSGMQIYIPGTMMTTALLSIGFLLVEKWVTAMNLLDDFNRHLAQELHASELLLTETLTQRHAQERQAALQSERERLMRDLHDGVSNRLVSAMASCALNGDAFKEVETTLRGTLGELRLVITSLNDLDGDLAQGIANFLPQLQRQVRPLGVTLECHTADLAPIPWLRPAHVQQILRILQESVMNAAKHSGAKIIRIEAPSQADGEPARIHVRDEGHGGVHERPGSFGLHTMRARAQELGADLHITSGPDGTEVTLCLPARAPSR